MDNNELDTRLCSTMAKIKKRFCEAITGVIKIIFVEYFKRLKRNRGFTDLISTD